MMLHADDLMAPGCLASLLPAASGAAFGVDLVVGRHRTFADPMEPSELHPRFAVPSIIPGSRLLRDVLAYHCPFVPFILMRKAAYVAVGGLDERWELVQDWDLWMRICRRGDVLALCAEVGWWRTHGTSPTYRRINAREHVALAEALHEVAPELPVATRERAKRLACANASLQLANDAGAGRDAPRDGEMPGTAVPAPSDPQRMLTRLNREVALRQLWLRIVGFPRAAHAGKRLAGTSPRNI